MTSDGSNLTHAQTFDRGGYLAIQCHCTRHEQICHKVGVKFIFLSGKQFSANRWLNQEVNIILL